MRNINLVDDFAFAPCTGTPCWGKTDHHEKHTASGFEYWHGIFFVGCQIWSPDAEGCYKYEQFYQFYNSGNGDPKPRFQHWLKIYGDGYDLGHGVPTSYQTYWRIDTDIIDSGSDKYEQYAGAWTPVDTETTFTTIGTTGEDGTEWRTYDNNQGISKRVGIGPVLTDFDKIRLLR